jgi:hypothetical protein
MHVRTKTRFFPMHPGQPRSAIVRVCASCGTHQSTAWRVDENGERLCNKLALNRVFCAFSRMTFYCQVWIAEEETEQVGRNVCQWRMHSIACCTLRGLPDRVDDNCNDLNQGKAHDAFARQSVGAFLKAPIYCTKTIPTGVLYLRRSVLPSHRSPQLDFLLLDAPQWQ